MIEQVTPSPELAAALTRLGGARNALASARNVTAAARDAMSKALSIEEEAKEEAADALADALNLIEPPVKLKENRLYVVDGVQWLTERDGKRIHLERVKPA